MMPDGLMKQSVTCRSGSTSGAGSGFGRAGHGLPALLKMVLNINTPTRYPPRGRPVKPRAALESSDGPNGRDRPQECKPVQDVADRSFDPLQSQLHQEVPQVVRRMPQAERGGGEDEDPPDQARREPVHAVVVRGVLPEPSEGTADDETEQEGGKKGGHQSPPDGEKDPEQRLETMDQPPRNTPERIRSTSADPPMSPANCPKSTSAAGGAGSPPIRTVNTVTPRSRNRIAKKSVAVNRMNA